MLHRAKGRIPHKNAPIKPKLRSLLAAVVGFAEFQGGLQAAAAARGTFCYRW
jgi:hypothetical protein